MFLEVFTDSIVANRDRHDRGLEFSDIFNKRSEVGFLTF